MDWLEKLISPVYSHLSHSSGKWKSRSDYSWFHVYRKGGILGLGTVRSSNSLCHPSRPGDLGDVWTGAPLLYWTVVPLLSPIPWDQYSVLLKCLCNYQITGK